MKSGAWAIRLCRCAFDTLKRKLVKTHLTNDRSRYVIVRLSNMVRIRRINGINYWSDTRIIWAARGGSLILLCNLKCWEPSTAYN